MKNLDSENKCICWDTIKFNKKEMKKFKSISENEKGNSIHIQKEENSNPYKFNPELNKRIYIANSDVLSLNFSDCPLRPDALVLQSNKNIFKLRSSYRQRILQECGTKILDDFKLYSELELSECVLTDSHSLANFKKIIHVVLPKFNPSFQNAGESSLHLSIRNIFDICLQKNIGSILFGYEIFLPSENFPLDITLHNVLRTIRKCLEKFKNKFSAIFFVIEKREVEIFSKLKETLGIYFPRSFEEEEYHKDKLDEFNSLKVTEFGDVILPERQLDHKFYLEINYNDTKSFEFQEFYLREEDDIKNYKIYKNDENRITNSLTQSKDFYKKFFLEALNNSNKSSIKDMYSYFDMMKFFDYKGSDILKRHIFFFHLKLINFYDIDNEHLTDQLILYLAEYIKNTINALKQKSSSRFSFIIFCKDAIRKNYPTVYFIKTVSKIVSSLIFNAKFKIEDVEIVLFQPGFVLKLFIYFLRIYVDSSVWNRIEFVENYELLNKKFYLEIDEDTQYENLRIKFMDEKNLSTQSKLEREYDISIKEIYRNKFKSNAETYVNMEEIEICKRNSAIENKDNNVSGKFKAKFDFNEDDNNNDLEKYQNEKESFFNIIN